MPSRKSKIRPLFITGIGTGVGKTVIAAIVTEALDAWYWKPVQAGLQEGTDTQWVTNHISRGQGRVLSETYRFSLAASPHIAARAEGTAISLERIVAQFEEFCENVAAESTETSYLVIEGAGGLLVPLNDQQFVMDLIVRLEANVLLVSRNYLGSINHSLLTAAQCKASGLRIAGWIFNDQYLNYEQEIVEWTGIPSVASIPLDASVGRDFVLEQATRIAPSLRAALSRIAW